MEQDAGEALCSFLTLDVGVLGIVHQLPRLLDSEFQLSDLISQ